MKLKRQRAVLAKSAALLFGYGGSSKRAKKLYKSVYKRMPARMVARMLAESELRFQIDLGMQRTLSRNLAKDWFMCFSTPASAVSIYDNWLWVH